MLLQLWDRSKVGLGFELFNCPGRPLLLELEHSEDAKSTRLSAISLLGLAIPLGIHASPVTLSDAAYFDMLLL